MAPAAVEVDGGRKGSALPVLASLVLPGSGEAMLGHKRGYLMMALDIFAWTQVAKKHSDGGELRDKYYAFADEHYSDDLLLAAYVAGGSSVDGFYRDGIGTDYFDFGAISTLADLENLPLYVTVEDDRREYYENLGKWDQFVFGWDDFIRPDDDALTPAGYAPTGDPKIDLQQPWVSENRETYRQMRDGIERRLQEPRPLAVREHRPAPVQRAADGVARRAARRGLGRGRRRPAVGGRARGARDRAADGSAAGDGGGRGFLLTARNLSVRRPGADRKAEW